MKTSKCGDLRRTANKFLQYCLFILAIALVDNMLAAGADTGINGNPMLKFKQPAFFEKPISKVGDSAEAVQEAGILQVALSASKDKSTLEQVELLEAFVADYPNSVWSASLRVNLGRFYLDEGYYSKSMDYWQAAWLQTKDIGSGTGKQLADYALVNLIRSLTGMGWVESVDVLLAESKGRTIDNGPLVQRLFHSQEMLRTIKKRPELTYRCGWMCLDKYSKAARGSGLDRKKRDSYYPKGNLLGACSVESMRKIASNEGMKLSPVRRPADSKDIPVPSIMHLKQGHYITLIEWQDGLIWAYDPLWGYRLFRPEMVNAETSGIFMVPIGQLAGWKELTPSEAVNYIGRCGGNPGYFSGFLDGIVYDCESCGCPPGGVGNGDGGSGSGNCKTCGTSKVKTGMPQWKVLEPNILLWIQDEPVSCQTPFGPAIPFRLNYKQHDEYGMSDPAIFGFGYGWNCPWLSCAADSGGYRRWQNVYVFLPGGGKLTFEFTAIGAVTKSAKDYYTDSRLDINFTAGVLQNYIVTMPDGRQYVYSQPFAGYSRMFLTRSVDNQGFSTYFNYSTDLDGTFLRLDTVAGHDNQTLFSLTYTEVADWPNVVSRVTNRNGDYAELTYDPNSPLLTQIRDAAGITNAIAYNDLIWPEKLTTPYGTNSFEYDSNGTCEGYRRITVTEPDGGRQIFMFHASCAYLADANQSLWFETDVPASLIPTSNLPAGAALDHFLNQLNSFYWDRKQSENVPTDLSLMTTNIYNKARMRHWLDASAGDYFAPELTLSFERSPSQNSDGSTFGHITWYDYVGKPLDSQGNTIFWEKGSQNQPSLIARKLPDGSTWYESIQRNSFGLPTSKTSTYGTGDPASTRTLYYEYDSNNNIDLVTERGNSYELLASYTYNGQHQVLTETRYPTNQVPYTTTCVYNDTYGRLTSRTMPGGITTTYSYGTDGYLSQTSDAPVSRVESFTWLNGYMRTHTDARGFVTTYTRDALGRLTQIDYPGSPGSSAQYVYSIAPWQGFNYTGYASNILDVTAIKDRMGYWTTNTYDRLRRVVAVTDARNNTTSYEYCGCGSPETITDALTHETVYTFNNAGQKTDVVYPDATSEHFYYNELGQLISSADSLGTRYFYYNNQGLLIATYGPNGYEKQIVYDIDDNPVSVTDANGVTVTQTFDWLGRLLTKAVPGLNTEQYAYSARGLTSFTGADTKTTSYTYDEAGRKLTETTPTPKSEIISYSYNAAGDLLTLTDGRSKVTTWTYDTEGHVKSKKYHGQASATLLYDYDADGRLTNRWTSAKGYARYRYDGAANLTNVVYDASPALTYKYDAVNRLTNMVDAYGTSKYSYTNISNLLTEDGPLASDTVTYGYHATAPGLRTSLTLQQTYPSSWSQTYAYDGSRRLQTLTSPAGTFTYTYKAAGMLWTNLALPNAAAITNAYDNGARLAGTWLKSTAGIINQHLYQYNTGGRRSVQTRTDLSYVNYTYDSDGQLESARGYTYNGTAIATEQKGYAYDASWNLSYRTNNGAVSPFGVDNLNQLTAIPGGTCTYDGNGNLIADGTRIFSYDDENQLSRIVIGSYHTDLVYDGKQRLRKRVESYFNGSVSNWVSDTHYIYDGMRVIQERDNVNTSSVSYTRGNDLGGSLERAGGIGGLLARSTGYGSGSAHHYYHADGNGNITAMVDSARALSATYRYDSYGGLLSSSGTMAAVNLYRFSSKMLLSSSVGLYYYGYRFYEPNFQRWLNRDPLGEAGFEVLRVKGPNILGDGPNPYVFVRNHPINSIDAFGLFFAPPGSADTTALENIGKPITDPNFTAAKKWLKKCHPALDVCPSMLSNVPGYFGADGFSLIVAAVVVPGKSTSDYVDTLVHEGLHCRFGPAMSAKVHDLMYDLADQISREYDRDPNGTKCGCKK
jgi:RHS repeat-associated protein